MAVQTTQHDIVYRSKLPDIHIPNHLPLHSYIFQNKSHLSSKPCIINGTTGDIHTYADVELTSRKVASGLNKLGIKQGDVIMLLLPNTPEFVFAFLGASFCGAMTTAANPFFTPAEIAKQAKASKAKLIDRWRLGSSWHHRRCRFRVISGLKTKHAGGAWVWAPRWSRGTASKACWIGFSDDAESSGVEVLEGTTTVVRCEARFEHGLDDFVLLR